MAPDYARSWNSGLIIPRLWSYRGNAGIAEERGVKKDDGPGRVPDWHELLQSRGEISPLSIRGG